ncbi:hypothetical protein [Streptomyces fagopyri]|uniref:hypothetical protein n=1 Tax=Streptomyces fagopyri TaxID=2662397 RepID=UPI0033C32906
MKNTTYKIPANDPDRNSPDTDNSTDRDSSPSHHGSSSTPGSGGSTGGGTSVGAVHPGSYCSPPGATGVTQAGTPMVCGPASDGRNRWHRA